MAKAAKCDLCKKLYEPYDEKKLIKANEKDMIFIDVFYNEKAEKTFNKILMDLCSNCRSSVLSTIIELSK